MLWERPHVDAFCLKGADGTLLIRRTRTNDVPRSQSGPDAPFQLYPSWSCCKFLEWSTGLLKDLGFVVNAGSSALGFPLGARETHRGTSPASRVSQHQSLLGMSVHRALALQGKCLVFTPPLRARPERPQQLRTTMLTLSLQGFFAVSEMSTDNRRVLIKQRTALAKELGGCTAFSSPSEHQGCTENLAGGFCFSSGHSSSLETRIFTSSLIFKELFPFS